MFQMNQFFHLLTFFLFLKNVDLFRETLVVVRFSDLEIIHVKRNIVKQNLTILVRPTNKSWIIYFSLIRI